MNTSTRNILSTLSGLALVVYFAIAFVTAGFASTSAVLGLSALVGWALVQMILLDLAPHSAAAVAPAPTTVPPVQAATVIEFPPVEAAQRQAA